MPKIWFTLALFFTVSITCFSAAEDLTARFFSEFQDSHRVLENKFESVVVRAAMEFSDGVSVNYSAFNKDRMFRMEFEIDSRIQVLCRSKTGWFACTKLPSSQGWILAISSDSEDSMPDSFLECEKLLAPHFTIFGSSLRSLVSSPEFNLISTRELTEQGSLFLELEFDTFPVTQVGSKNRISVSVDPANEWRIVSAKIGIEEGDDIAIQVSYSPDSLLPTELFLRLGNEISRTVRYEGYSFENLPNEPFELGYYGFSPKANRSYLFYLIVFVAAISGILLAYFWKSKS